MAEERPLRRAHEESSRRIFFASMPPDDAQLRVELALDEWMEAAQGMRLAVRLETTGDAHPDADFDP